MNLLQKAFDLICIWNGMKPNFMPEIAAALSRRRIVKAYGGNVPIQIAALLMHSLEEERISELTLEAEFGQDVANLVRKTREDLSLSWRERKQQLLDKAVSCCQGVAILLLAEQIDKLAHFMREMPCVAYNEFKDYWLKQDAGGHEYLWYATQLVRTLHGNMRVLHNVEYSTLDTSKATKELGRIAFDFEHEFKL